MQTNRNHELHFEGTTVKVFRCLSLNLYPKICKKLLTVLKPFARFTCANRNFVPLSIKTKHRNRLNPQADLKIPIS